MATDTYTAKEAGDLLAYGRSAQKATNRFRHWRQAGILPPAGRDRGGKLAAFRFERAQVAAAAVLFWIHDNAGIQRPEQLRGLFDILANPREGGSMALIDAVLEDIEQDGAPVLIITRWINPQAQVGLSFEVRLQGEIDLPIIAPGDNWQPVQDCTLSLAPLLDSFTAPVVVPFPVAGNA